MYLKKYQQRVISEIKEFLTIAKQTKIEFEAIVSSIPESQRSIVASNMNYVQTTHEKLKLEYNDLILKSATNEIVF